jgi:hypothetical protein
VRAALVAALFIMELASLRGLAKRSHQKR